jgi:hypothetical protein
LSFFLSTHKIYKTYVKKTKYSYYVSKVQKLLFDAKIFLVLNMATCALSNWYFSKINHVQSSKSKCVLINCNILY